MTCCHNSAILFKILLLIATAMCDSDLNLRDKRRSEMLVISPPGKNQEIHKETYFSGNSKDCHQPRNVIKKRDVEDDDDDDDTVVNDHTNDAAFLGIGQKKMSVPPIRSGPKMWDHWGKWSDCSVTCGIGKITRWRHCTAGGCSPGEKEAQIKTCTQPAC